MTDEELHEEPESEGELPARPLERFRSLAELELFYLNKEKRYAKDITEIFERENKLIRAALDWPHAVVSMGVDPGMFQVKDYRFVFECVKTLVKSGVLEIGKSMHAGTLAAEMQRAYTKADGHFADRRAELWIDELWATPDVAFGYAMRTLVPAQVAQHNVKLWKMDAERLIAASKDEWRVVQLQDDWRELKDKIDTAHDGGEVGRKMSDLVRDWNPHDKSNGNLIKTGFLAIDRASGGGAGRGEMMVIGGGTHGGKSYIVQRLAANQAENKSPTLIISCEDDSELMVARSLADVTQIRPIEIRTRDEKARPEVVERAKEYLANLYGDYVFYVDAPKSPVSRICRMIQRHRYLFGINMVIVDYLQAIEEDEPTNQRTNDVANIIHKLTKCAKDNGVALVLMSQYSREEYKNGAEPGLTSCKFAGEIENECQILLLTWIGDQGERFVKIGKLKWTDAAGQRYLIPVDPTTGCIGNDWGPAFQQEQADRRQARATRDRANGSARAGGNGYGPNGNGGGNGA